MCFSSFGDIYSKILYLIRYLLGLSSNSLLFASVIFLVSFISNSIPYVSIPYLALILLYSSYTGFGNVLSLITTVLSSALGAALGKIVIYYLGRGFSNIIIGVSNETYIKLLSKFLDKSIFLAIAIFAATPLPDDILYIPVGVLRYPLLKFFIACFVGKFVLTSFVFYSGGIIHSIVSLSKIQYAGMISTVVSVAITIIVLFVMKRLDWAKLVEVLSSHGIVRGSILVVMRAREFIRRSRE